MRKFATRAAWTRHPSSPSFQSPAAAAASPRRGLERRRFFFSRCFGKKFQRRRRRQIRVRISKEFRVFSLTVGRESGLWEGRPAFFFKGRTISQSSTALEIVSGNVLRKKNSSTRELSSETPTNSERKKCKMSLSARNSEFRISFDQSQIRSVTLLGDIFPAVAVCHRRVLPCLLLDESMCTCRW